MPGFDPEISKIAERVLIKPRDIETYVGVLAKSIKPGTPVAIELVDAKSKEAIEILEVDACLVATGRIPATKNLGLEFVGVELDKRGFIAVNDKMQVIQDGEPIPHLWAVGVTLDCDLLSAPEAVRHHVFVLKLGMDADHRAFLVVPARQSLPVSRQEKPAVLELDHRVEHRAEVGVVRDR